MRNSHALAVAVVLASFAAPQGVFAEQASNKSAKNHAEQGWTRLFNGEDLDGWYVYLQRQKKNEDPAKVVQVHDGAIHLYKDQPDGGSAPVGYLATKAEFGNYHLRLEYKWGKKKFRPRHEQRRDAGLLYHVVGSDTVWPRCIECQVQENDTGDCFTVRGTRVTTSVEIAEIETPGGRKKLPRYKPQSDGGVPKTIGDGSIARIVKSSTHERDGWNTVEVVVRGSAGAAHIVNGHTVFEARDLRQLASDSKEWEPLTHGRIALQAEFAEVFYRNIEIRPIPDGPLHATAAD